MKPPIITSSPICTKARVLMLLRCDATVTGGVGDGICARNCPTVTTVNTKANQKLIHTPSKTLPMYGVDQKRSCLASTKSCRYRRAVPRSDQLGRSERYIASGILVLEYIEAFGLRGWLSKIPASATSLSAPRVYARERGLSTER